MAQMPKPKLILMKIAGTTTDRKFTETLLPYAENRMKDFLTEDWADGLSKHWADELTVDLIAYMRKEADLDPDAPAIKNQNQNEGRLLKETIAYVNYLFTEMGYTCKGRQMLYPLIWYAGYNSGRLKSHVFPDVADAIYCWHKMGIPVCVYSGGNAIANKMIFTFSQEGGNLNKFIRKYLDVNVYGRKDDDKSYDKIAAEFGIKTKEMLFLTDDVAEGAAARDARVRCLIVRRPNNAEVTQEQLTSIGCDAVSSFLDVHFDMDACPVSALSAVSAVSTLSVCVSCESLLPE